MKTPDEIKKGLDLCGGSGYEGSCTEVCSYHGGEPGKVCFEVLTTDALAYIRQLEAKVAELEKRCDAEQENASAAIRECAEVKLRCLEHIKVYADKLAEYEKLLAPLTWEGAIADDCYLERRDDKYVDMGLNILAMSTDGPEPGLTDCIHFMTHSEEDVKLMRYDYGKTWRCWPRRPTDEERKAAKWEMT